MCPRLCEEFSKPLALATYRLRHAVNSIFACLCRMYAQRVGQLKGRVALDTITAVEFVEESAFNLPHTFQVSHAASLCQWCV